MTFCGTWCCTRCIANESRNVLAVTGRMENVTPSRAATTTCFIQLRAVSSLLMSQSRASAGRPAVVDHSRNRCKKPGSVSGIVADFCLRFALRLLLLTGRPPVPAAAGRLFQPALLEHAQDYER